MNHLNIWKDRSIINEIVVLLKEIVGSTQGPRGSVSIIEEEYGDSFKLTKDGSNVLQSLKADNKIVNIVLDKIKKYISDRADKIGDGTTTMSCLIGYCIDRMHKHFEYDKVDIIEFQKGISIAVELIYKDLQKLNKQISESELESVIKAVTYQVSNGDKEISEVITQAIMSVGSEGSISIEQSPSQRTYLEFRQGYSMNFGLRQDLFTIEKRNHKDIKDIIEKSNMHLILSGIDMSLSILVSIAQECIRKNISEITIISSHSISESIMNFIKATMTSGMKLYVIELQGSESMKVDILNDISALSGIDIFYGNDQVQSISDSDVNTQTYNISQYIGKVNKIEFTNNDTKIFEDKNHDNLQKYISQLKDDIKNKKEKGENVQQLEIRKSKLAKGVGIVMIGSSVDMNINEMIDRAQDALCAGRTVHEGITITTSLLFYIIARHVKQENINLSSHEKLGFNMCIDALEDILPSLMRNNLVDSSVMKKYDKIYNGKIDIDGLSKGLQNYNNNGLDIEIYDIRAGKFVNMYESHLFDPYNTAKGIIETFEFIIGLSNIKYISYTPDKNESSKDIV